jgi:hypothetical protein
MTAKTPPAEVQRGVSYTARVWTWRLWGLADARLDFVATVATLALLAVSRFALLPSGPWEWDETLFARGLLKFDLPAHFPHPPGFPLWMALGWVMLRLVGNPLLGFQLLSAAASCLAVFPLAALGRRCAPPPVATTAALALLFAPGVWLHAGRGFTDTAAAFFALWAAALASWGLEGRRATAFTLLVTAAFLIRPILLPPLGLLWLAGALTVHPRRRLVPGAALGVAATAAGVLGLVLAQGSWERFAAAFAAHARTHAVNLIEHNPGGLLDLGLVKGVGGPWFAAGLAVLALLGTLVWARRVAARPAAAWLAILAVVVIQLVWLQNRRFPRYAVPLDMALAPLLAAGASAAAPPVVAAATLAALGSVWGITIFPLLVEQHRTSLPGWAAVRQTVARASETGAELVVEPGLYPFLSYQEELDQRGGRPWKFRWTLAPSSPDSNELPSGPYLLVTDYPFHYFGSMEGDETRFPTVSGRLLPLTQGRFLNVALFRNAALPVRGWWLPEVAEDLGKFMWGGAEAEMLVPPLPAGAALVLDFGPYRGAAPLDVVINGTVALTVPGEAPRAAHTVAPRLLSTERTNRVVFHRTEGYVPGERDQRRLSVQLWGITFVERPFPSSDSRASSLSPR